MFAFLIFVLFVESAGQIIFEQSIFGINDGAIVDFVSPVPPVNFVTLTLLIILLFTPTTLDA
jgi:hypothetical protein